MPAATLAPQNTAARRATAPLVRAGYARISIEEATTGGASIARQVDGMRRLDPEMRIFEDDGVSGTKTSRPGFDALLRYLREEKVTELVVARLDRLGRNHELKTLVPDLFHKHGCRVVCTEEESPDLGTDIGRLVFDIKCNLSCLESDRIGRRIQAARSFQFSKGSFDGPRAGYLCINGKLIPDDQPRHCPLAQKRSVGPEVDEWGIAIDAWVGFSNFEIAAIPVKYALRYRNWHSGWEYAHGRLGLTVSGSWDPARNCYVEHQGKRQIEELLIINGAPVKTTRMLQSLNPGNRSTIRQRANNPVFYGHFHGRRNWDPDARPSLNQKRKGYGYIDTDTFEFFTENAHVPMLSEEDYAITVEMNNAARADEKRGLKPGAGGGWRMDLEQFSEEVMQTKLLLRSVARRSRCNHCGGRLRSVFTGQKRKYFYLSCINPDCAFAPAQGRLESVLTGLALQLAETARKLQAGELPPIKSRPAEIAAIRELEEAREGQVALLQRKPDNKVLRNQLKKLDEEIAALKAGGAAAPTMEALKAHQRFRHPRAQEPGAWLELLRSGTAMAEEVLAPIRWIQVSWVKPDPSEPVRGVKPKWAPEVTGLELFDEA
jgi:DNA invertase Pin-like site-specific DNA recombinase